MSETAVAKLLQECSHLAPEEISLQFILGLSAQDADVLSKEFRKLSAVEQWNARATVEEIETYQKQRMESCLKRASGNIRLIQQEWLAVRRLQEAFYF